MASINVDGLPEPVASSIQAMVARLKEQFTAAENFAPGDGLRRSAGGWSDDPTGLDEYLAEVRRSRDAELGEPIQ